MIQTTTRGLYDYWNTVRGGRLAPRRYEIEPSEIVSYLSETIILEQPSSNTCRIRVAGTKVCEHLGADLRGEYFFEMWDEADRTVLHNCLLSVTKYGGVGVIRFSGLLYEDATSADFEMLLLPLTHLDENIERVLGSISILNDPEWLASSHPARLKLTSSEIVWPEGRPHGMARHTPGAAPTHQHIPTFRSELGHDGYRRARLVRHQKRRFLVYDGGLATTSTPNTPIAPEER